MADLTNKQEKITWSLAKRSNRLTKFGYSDTTQILGSTIKFIDCDTTLRNLLCLSRELYEILHADVLKQSLLRVR